MRKTSLALLLCAAGAWAASQSWSPDDLWNRRVPGDPRISPDGQQVVYVESWNDRATNNSCGNLWLVSTHDKQPHRLTEGAWRDQSPRWSPDGKHIAWVSGRGGIHVIELASRQELSIEAAPLTLAWSSDGRFLAFTTRAGLFVVSSNGGPAQPITGPDLEVEGEPAWMPDGKSILIAAADGGIHSIRLSDHAARRLMPDTGRSENPLPSPDGAKIAWIATDPRPYSYSVRKLYVMNADGSRVKALAAALDRDPVQPRWSADSRTIYFLVDDAGSTHVYASRADSTLRQVTKTVERLDGFSLADNGHAVSVRSTERSVDVVTFAVDVASTPEVLASPMEKLMAERKTGAVEEIHFPSAGKSIEAWLVKPPLFDSAKKYPMLLDIADAPRRMYGPEFSLWAQIYAAQGWVVLRVNPRGAPGYGEEFGRLLSTRYPGDDAEDLLTAVDFVVAKGGIDPGRVAVSGGLLTAWMIGHTDRFSTAVARRPIIDFTLYAATHAREVLSWMGAMPWEDPEQYTRHSPIYFAQNWKTPTLVLAGDPDPQSDEFYAVLQQRKVKSSLVRESEEGRPASRVRELETILAWLQGVER